MGRFPTAPKLLSIIMGIKYINCSGHTFKMNNPNPHEGKTIVCSVCNSIVSLNEIFVIDADESTIQFRCNKCNRYSNSVVEQRGNHYKNRRTDG